MKHLAVGAVAMAFLAIIIVIGLIAYQVAGQAFWLFLGAIISFGLGVAFVDWITERREG
jgi:hypothetical protein